MSNISQDNLLLKPSWYQFFPLKTNMNPAKVTATAVKNTQYIITCTAPQRER